MRYPFQFSPAFASHLSLENGAGLEKCPNSIGAIFAADAGVFEAAPGGLGIVKHGIDIDPSRADLVGHLACPIQVCSKDVAAKPILRVICDQYGFFFVVVCDHAKDRAENLLLSDRHVVRHIDENGWFHEMTALEALWMTLTADEHFGTLRDALAYVSLYPLVLLVADHR